MRVVLLEAGGDPLSTSQPGLPEGYEVPAFHPLASEHPAMRWDFFVRHYADKSGSGVMRNVAPKASIILAPARLAAARHTTR